MRCIGIYFPGRQASRVRCVARPPVSALGWSSRPGAKNTFGASIGNSAHSLRLLPGRQRWSMRKHRASIASSAHSTCRELGSISKFGGPAPPLLAALGRSVSDAGGTVAAVGRGGGTGPREPSLGDLNGYAGRRRFRFLGPPPPASTAAGAPPKSGVESPGVGKSSHTLSHHSCSVGLASSSSRPRSAQS